MSIFVDILLNKNTLPPPPVGYGRIHRIDDSEDEIPGQSIRFQEILWAIDSGASSYDRIVSTLSFRMPKTLLVADCEELAEHGEIIIKRSGSSTRYFPVTYEDVPTEESASA